jgi:hypothetical protein
MDGLVLGLGLELGAWWLTDTAGGYLGVLVLMLPLVLGGGSISFHSVCLGVGREDRVGTGQLLLSRRLNQKKGIRYYGTDGRLIRVWLKKGRIGFLTNSTSYLPPLSSAPRSGREARSCLFPHPHRSILLFSKDKPTHIFPPLNASAIFLNLS